MNIYEIEIKLLYLLPSFSGKKFQPFQMLIKKSYQIILIVFEQVRFFVYKPGNK